MADVQTGLTHASSTPAKLRSKRVVVDCAIPPAEYWRLKDDEGYREYAALNGDPPTTPEVQSEETDDDGWTTRRVVLTAISNPVPYALRGVLGCKDGFKLRVTERFRRDNFDEAHKSTFISEPPVLTDSMKILGSCWVEPHGSGSRLFFELRVSCEAKGAGVFLANRIGDKALIAYRQNPRITEQYVALRRAAAEANEAAATADGELGRGSGAESADGAAEDGQAGGRLPAALAKRARLRWHMALMHVRFARVLELQRTEEHRLCDARVSEPRTEGFGPKRHTTYLVATRIRSDDGEAAWVECRKRFSEFLSLRDELLAFLPGVELPDLPEKGAHRDRLSAGVVAARRATLETALQVLPSGLEP